MSSALMPYISNGLMVGARRKVEGEVNVDEPVFALRPQGNLAAGVPGRFDADKRFFALFDDRVREELEEFGFAGLRRGDDVGVQQLVGREPDRKFFEEQVFCEVGGGVAHIFTPAGKGGMVAVGFVESVCPPF